MKFRAKIPYPHVNETPGFTAILISTRVTSSAHVAYFAADLSARRELSGYQEFKSARQHNAIADKRRNERNIVDDITGFLLR